ncbi:MAG: hypothetical protein ACXW34_10250, partial [Nitrospira sp.]
YSHGGHGWNQELRRAVTLLETMVLSDGLSYGQPSVELDIDIKALTHRKIRGKVGGPNGI